MNKRKDVVPSRTEGNISHGHLREQIYRVSHVWHTREGARMNEQVHMVIPNTCSLTHPPPTVQLFSERVALPPTSMVGIRYGQSSDVVSCCSFHGKPLRRSRHMASTFDEPRSDVSRRVPFA